SQHAALSLWRRSGLRTDLFGDPLQIRLTVDPAAVRPRTDREHSGACAVPRILPGAILSRVDVASALDRHGQRGSGEIRAELFVSCNPSDEREWFGRR